MEPVTAGLITAGVSALGQGATAYAQGKMNRKTREWNEKMYNLQRQHSLADWTMQNEYNSPQAQMQRLKMAGLNPNLVYGKGADNVAGSVRSADSKSWNPQSPNLNFGESAATGLNAYLNTELRQAQIDNLKTQNTAIANEAILKAAQTESTLQSTSMSKFDLGLKSELRQISLQAATENLRKLTTDIDISLQSNDRAAAQNASSLKEAVERILTSRESRAKTIVEKEQIRNQINLMKKDGELKDLDLNLKRIGVQPGDNIILRAAGQYLNQKGNKITQWWNSYDKHGWKKK